MMVLYVAIAAAAVVGLSLVNEQIAERFSFEAISAAEQSDIGDRPDLYWTALGVMRDHPFGVGLGNFSNYHEFISAPHNLILEVGSELGWIAAIVVVVFLIAMVFRIRRLVRRDRGLGIYLGSLFYYQLIIQLTGAELTLQSFLFFLSGATIWLLTRRPMFASWRPVAGPDVPRGAVVS